MNDVKEGENASLTILRQGKSQKISVQPENRQFHMPELESLGELRELKNLEGLRELRNLPERPEFRESMRELQREMETLRKEMDELKREFRDND